MLALIFTGPILESISALNPPKPEDTVEEFINAFNEPNLEKMCGLLTPTTRRPFDRAYVPPTYDPGENVEDFMRELGREDDLPGGDHCVAGAEAVRRGVGRISSGRVTRTVRETDRLAYAMTSRGRWKLTWNGDSWRLAGHPPLETLTDS